MCWRKLIKRSFRAVVKLPMTCLTDETSEVKATSAWPGLLPAKKMSGGRDDVMTIMFAGSIRRSYQGDVGKTVGGRGSLFLY